MTEEFEKGLKELFEPIALSCDQRLKAIVNEQQRLLRALSDLEQALLKVQANEADEATFVDLVPYTRQLRDDQKRLRVVAAQCNVIQHRVHNMNQYALGKPTTPMPSKFADELDKMKNDLAQAKQVASAFTNASRQVFLSVGDSVGKFFATNKQEEPAKTVESTTNE